MSPRLLLLSRARWAPIAFVVVALLLLLVTPLIVEQRASRLRERVQSGSEHGRLLLNDLEAAFASQLLAGPSADRSDTTAVASDAHLLNDESELRTTMERVSPEAAAQLAELVVLLHAWESDRTASPADPTNAQRAREIFRTSERLDNFLMQVSAQQRQTVRKLERVNVVTAMILAPIALLAVVIVIWSGERTVQFAADADAQRTEVVRAADARAALLRGVTHDVKNPLGAAAGYAQLLEERVVGELSPAQTDMVKRIRRLVEQSVDTVTDLLELARADSGGLSIEYAHADLAQLAREVVDDHSGSARECELRLEFAGDATPVVTDPRRVRQVLGNLLGNAIKYTPKGGSVRVAIVSARVGAAAGAKGRVGVAVEDDGPGIPLELRPRVFEEFFRVRAGENAARGNGLGLAISRRIAHLLGGDVTFAPGKERGSVFTLWLEER